MFFHKRIRPIIESVITTLPRKRIPLVPGNAPPRDRHRVWQAGFVRNIRRNLGCYLGHGFGIPNAGEAALR